MIGNYWIWVTTRKGGKKVKKKATSKQQAASCQQQVASSKGKRERKRGSRALSSFGEEQQAGECELGRKRKCKAKKEAVASLSTKLDIFDVSERW